jgi:hypothetical protein
MAERRSGKANQRQDLIGVRANNRKDQSDRLRNRPSKRGSDHPRAPEQQSEEPAEDRSNRGPEAPISKVTKREEPETCMHENKRKGRASERPSTAAADLASNLMSNTGRKKRRKWKTCEQSRETNNQVRKHTTHT